MTEFMPWILSNQMAALVVPMIIFFAVMILVVRKMISFGMVLTFLTFALISGFAISNYDVVRSNSSNGSFPATTIEWKETLGSFTEQIASLVEGVRSDSSNKIENVQLTADEILRRLEQYQSEQNSVANQGAGSLEDESAI